MAYNNINRFILYQKVINIVNKEFEPGLTTYSGVWRKYVNPIYPMSYNTFLKIINMPNVDKQLEQERAKVGRQLELF